MSQVAEAPPAEKPPKPKFHSYPIWCARFWHGMYFGDWFQLVKRHGFRIHPFRLPMACSISFFSTFNSVMARVQDLLFGRKIDETKLPAPPVFILGHWRSGTTFLHELMVVDDRFCSASTYQCFAPNHFLLTEWLVTKLAWWAVPAQRPMDNMAAGWNCPQEDEFALCNMGLPSPYLRCAFPNDAPEAVEYLNFEGVPQEDQETWKRGLKWFVQALTLKFNKRVILKSPPHTGRVKQLLETFPDARFVHITRNPDSVVPSSIRLWQALDLVEGMQVPHNQGVEDYVFEAFDRMYRGFEGNRHMIDPQRIYDIRYEDFVRDPVGQLQAIYEQLNLGDFSVVRPKIEAMVASRKDYVKNKHHMDESLRQKIRQHWSGYMERYGYADDAARV